MHSRCVFTFFMFTFMHLLLQMLLIKATCIVFKVYIVSFHAFHDPGVARAMLSLEQHVLNLYVYLRSHCRSNHYAFYHNCTIQLYFV